MYMSLYTSFYSPIFPYAIYQPPQASTASKQAPKHGMLLCSTRQIQSRPQTAHTPQHYS